MLKHPHISEILANVIQFLHTLDNCYYVLQEWTQFQTFYYVFRELFSNDDSQEILPAQSVQFSTLKEKWLEIARHTLNESRLLAVCSYPDLFDLFQVFNFEIGNILGSVGKYVDSKRSTFPRLYFLNTLDILQIFSPTSPSIFSSVLSKIFMFVSEIKINENVVFNLSKTKINGFVDLYGKTLSLNRNVSCSSHSPWINNLIDMMHHTVRDQIAEAYSQFSTDNYLTWLSIFNPHICFIVTQVKFFEKLKSANNSIKVKELTDSVQNIISELIPCVQAGEKNNFCSSSIPYL